MDSNKEVKWLMEFANESLECMKDIVKYAEEKGYEPHVFGSAIESINNLIKEKERKKK